MSSRGSASRPKKGRPGSSTSDGGDPQGVDHKAGSPITGWRFDNVVVSRARSSSRTPFWLGAGSTNRSTMPRAGIQSARPDRTHRSDHRPRGDLHRECGGRPALPEMVRVTRGLQVAHNEGASERRHRRNAEEQRRSAAARGGAVRPHQGGRGSFVLDDAPLLSTPEEIIARLSASKRASRMYCSLPQVLR